MGIVIRQSFWNSAVSYLGIALGALNVIWLFPTVLGQEQFGLTRLLLAGSMIGAQVAQLGMGNVTFRFFPQFFDEGRGHRGFLRLALGVPIIGLVLSVALFFLFRPAIQAEYAANAPLFITYDLYLVPMLAFTLYFNVFDAWLRSVYRTVAGSFLREVVLRLLQAGTVAMYYLGWVDFQGFVVAFVLAHAVQTLMAALWTAWVGEFPLGTPYDPPNPQIGQEMRSYGMYAILGGVSAMMVANLDVMMIGSLMGEQHVGIYAIAFFIGTFITVPERSISKISYPIIAQAFKDGNIRLVESMYRKTSLNQIVIGTLIFVGIWVNADQGVRLLPEGSELARNVMVIIAAAKLIDMATGANGVILLSSPWYRFDLVTNVLLVVLTVATNWMLIPWMGLDGAAWATLITIAVYNFVKYVYIWLKMDIQPLQPAAFKALLAGGVAWGAAWLVPGFESAVLDILARSAVITVVYGLCIVGWNVSDDVNRLLGLRK